MKKKGGACNSRRCAHVIWDHRAPLPRTFPVATLTCLSSGGVLEARKADKERILYAYSCYLILYPMSLCSTEYSTVPQVLFLKKTETSHGRFDAHYPPRGPGPPGVGASTRSPHDPSVHLLHGTSHFFLCLPSLVPCRQRCLSSTHMETEEYMIFPREKVRHLASQEILHDLPCSSAAIVLTWCVHRPGSIRRGSTTRSTGRSIKTA